MTKIGNAYEIEKNHVSQPLKVQNIIIYTQYIINCLYQSVYFQSFPGFGGFFKIVI